MLAEKKHRAAHDADLRKAMQSVVTAFEAVKDPTRIHTKVLASFKRMIPYERHVYDIEDLYSFRYDIQKILRKHARIIEDHQNPYIVEEYRRQLAGGLEAVAVLHAAFQEVKKTDPYYTEERCARLRKIGVVDEFRDTAYDWLKGCTSDDP